jgi:CMP-N-acetylneuraminic acid synthetase|tara:strand:+ start:876 stop:1535 length:660 start_codon:yes stop_codon:yes gene_type:complete
MLFFIIIKHNSERVKNKNFKKIGNQELWKHLVTTLKGQKVFIDTDSKKIIKVCNKSFPWVNAYKRDKKFVQLEKIENASPTLLMIKNFLKKYVKDSNEVIVTTHVTSPFLKLKTIKEAAKKLNFFDSIVAVTKDYNFAWLENKKKKLIPINFNPKIITKTQNLNPIIQSNGAFFIFKKKTFMKHNSRIGKKPYYFEIKFPESIEIDVKEDLNLARLVCR